MTEPVLTSRQRTLLRELALLRAEQTGTAPNIERSYQTRKDAAETEFEEAYQSVIIRFASEKEALDHELRETAAAVQQRYQAERAAMTREAGAARQKTLAQYEEAKESAKAAYREARWTLGAVYEGARADADTRLKGVQGQVSGFMQKLQSVQETADHLLFQWNQAPDCDEVTPEGGKRLRRLEECVAVAEAQLEELKGLVVPRFFKGQRLPILFVVLWLASVYPLVWWLGSLYQDPLLGWLYGLPASIVGAVVLFAVTRLILKSVARRQVCDVYLPLFQATADAEASRQRVLDHYARQRKRHLAEVRRQVNATVKKAAQKYQQARAAIKQRRKDELKKASANYQQRRAANKKGSADELREAQARYQRGRRETQDRYEKDSRQVQDWNRRLLAEIEQRFADDQRTLAEGWDQGLVRAQATVAEVNAECAHLFPAWDDPSWAGWTPPAEPPPVLRFGELRVRAEGLDDFTLPAVVGFPGQSPLVLRAGDEGRERAVEALQAVMFRLLAAVPPGKVRFTILDPVGLGQNFAAFMNLADHDEQLVTSRIWTEQAHLEGRLADLTAHMENVIQKYLRNQFETIQEYNAHAGEVAEPFRVLVVANFPANFSTEAARRLVSVVQSGPRCGVWTLISVDPKQPMPVGFDLAELERPGVCLVWQDDRFAWQDEDFDKFPLALDAPPAGAVADRILKVVGERAKEAGRVEVPFEFITAPAEQWWTADSRSGINVPLGRAGATKRQHLRLGHGTSQHVLVAGKTGSGKSTLLHALITNLALLYSPDEAELYLIDFKKGVEFKTYAAHELPHARVIAIESEREFGLSVLQRLDGELRQRGELFRAAGVQDIAGYREARPDAALPRILLIVDEFQEFFVEDDRLAQEAAQLLDRLVRQGRAFGLHVLLGSQTLGGTYSLARSTIDQMAVRIALQCSEADAHLILSDDNSAARLLSRPGEAIYNDANGLVEGNNPFQIVWLSEDRREEYLGRIRALAARRQALTVPPLVFEGNVDADVSRNPLLNRLLDAPAWGPEPRSCPAWLGEAVAIKDPTAATFRAQSGSNLLVVGQQDESALGMLVTALVSVAAQTPAARFFVLDGSAADAPYAVLLARLPQVLPQPVRVGGGRDLAAVLGEVSDEVERRQKRTNGETPPPVYVAVFGLQRFRDLRRSDDDFGFGRRDDQPSPAVQFAALLREGAGLGMHTLVWCDTYNNLQRALDRQALREFEMRVLFQMSVGDSSNLIDSPLAGRLGLHRALYHSEEEGRLEKLRPYGVPSPAWLTRVGERLRSRQPAAVAATPER